MAAKFKTLLYWSTFKYKGWPQHIFTYSAHTSVRLDDKNNVTTLYGAWWVTKNWPGIWAWWVKRWRLHNWPYKRPYFHSWCTVRTSLVPWARLRGVSGRVSDKKVLSILLSSSSNPPKNPCLEKFPAQSRKRPHLRVYVYCTIKGRWKLYKSNSVSLYINRHSQTQHKKLGWHNWSLACSYKAWSGGAPAYKQWVALPDRGLGGPFGEMKNYP